jgi:hypothetical protein
VRVIPKRASFLARISRSAGQSAIVERRVETRTRSRAAAERWAAWFADLLDGPPGVEVELLTLVEKVRGVVAGPRRRGLRC